MEKGGMSELCGGFFQENGGRERGGCQNYGVGFPSERGGREEDGMSGRRKQRNGWDGWEKETALWRKCVLRMDRAVENGMGKESWGCVRCGVWGEGCGIPHKAGSMRGVIGMWDVGMGERRE